jgi:ParB family chromosome partitioning protein
MAHKPGLGRGLGALIPGANDARGIPRRHHEIAVTDIRANPRQPRLVRSQEALQLEELAASIKEHGVIQPLIVTRTEGPGAPYTRWWRASGAGAQRSWPAWPACRPSSKKSPLRRCWRSRWSRTSSATTSARSKKRQPSSSSLTSSGLRPDAVAERVGKSRVAIYNTLRLLKLPGQAQAALMQGEISEGHARALLSLSSAVDQLAVLDEIKKHSLSVRQTEELIRRLNSPRPPRRKRSATSAGKEAKEYESRLREVLGPRWRSCAAAKGAHHH